MASLCARRSHTSTREKGGACASARPPMQQTNLMLSLLLAVAAALLTKKGSADLSQLLIARLLHLQLLPPLHIAAAWQFLFCIG